MALGSIAADTVADSMGEGTKMILSPTAPANGHTQAQTLVIPSNLCSIDIETAHADEKVIEREIEYWKPPANIKDADKLEAHRQAFAEKVREKSALLDAAPIACIGVRTEKTGMHFSAMSEKAYNKKREVYFIAPENECKMMIDFREWANKNLTDKTILVGFNIFAFDLPRMRAAYMRHDLKLPRALMPRILDAEKQPAIDVMTMFTGSFTADRYRDFSISLQEVERRLGFDEYKNKISGKEVPDMIAKGKFKEVLTYAELDATDTLASAFKMMGLSKNLK